MAEEQTLEQWFVEVDAEAEDLKVDKQKLLEKAEAAAKKFDPNEENVQVLWRLAKVTFRAASEIEVTGDKKKHKELLLKAEAFVNKALAIEPENGDAHAWGAYVNGKLADHLGTKERIQKGKLVQNHLERAIAAQPDQYSLHFTFGRWSMEVAKLSWVERKLAATLFEAVPEATYEDAVKHFDNCDKLKPNWRSCLYWKGKSLIALKKYKEAIQALDAAAACEVMENEDKVVEPDLKAMQTKYASYR